MEIDVSWKFKEVLPRLKTLKNQYQEILASFYYVRDENQFIYETKKKIYSFKFNENKIDKIWEYMNDDLSIIEIIMYLHLDS